MGEYNGLKLTPVGGRNIYHFRFIFSRGRKRERKMKGRV